MVVVAGDDDHLADGGAELAQHRLGLRQRRPRRPVPELERVAEQHEPVELSQARHQRRPLGLAAQHVRRAVGAEVQVRDDQRAQRPSGMVGGA